MASQESSDDADEQSVLMPYPPPEYSENPLPAAGEGQQQNRDGQLPQEQIHSASGVLPRAWPQGNNIMVSNSIDYIFISIVKQSVYKICYKYFEVLKLSSC
jgi:hypothetical protein